MLLIPNNKNLDELKSIESIELYARTLESQAKVNNSDTVSFIRTLPQFISANSILDAGCGPAAFANEIKELVGNKKYLGIDLEPGFIQLAKDKFKSYENFEFLVSDIHKFENVNFDIIFMYAVLQHVPSVSKALFYLSSKLNKNGSFVILDTREDDSEIITNPLVPALSKMYSSLHQISIERGRNKDCISESEKWADENKFKIEKKKFTETKLSTLEEKATFFWYSLYVSELLERFYQVKTNQKELLSQLTDWINTSNSTVKITGGVWMVLNRA